MGWDALHLCLLNGGIEVAIKGNETWPCCIFFSLHFSISELLFKRGGKRDFLQFCFLLFFIKNVKECLFFLTNTKLKMFLIPKSIQTVVCNFVRKDSIFYNCFCVKYLCRFITYFYIMKMLVFCGFL